MCQSVTLPFEGYEPYAQGPTPYQYFYLLGVQVIDLAMQISHTQMIEREESSRPQKGSHLEKV